MNSKLISIIVVFVFIFMSLSVIAIIPDQVHADTIPSLTPIGNVSLTGSAPYQDPYNNYTYVISQGTLCYFADTNYSYIISTNITTIVTGIVGDNLNSNPNYIYMISDLGEIISLIQYNIVNNTETNSFQIVNFQNLPLFTDNTFICYDTVTQTILMSGSYTTAQTYPQTFNYTEIYYTNNNTITNINLPEIGNMIYDSYGTDIYIYNSTTISIIWASNYTLVANAQYTLPFAVQGLVYDNATGTMIGYNNSTIYNLGTYGIMTFGAIMNITLTGNIIAMTYAMNIYFLYVSYTNAQSIEELAMINIVTGNLITQTAVSYSALSYNIYQNIIYAQTSSAIYIIPATAPTLELSFLEQGLPSGTTWNFTLNGNPYTVTTGNNITLNLPDNIYSYSFPNIETNIGLMYPAPQNGSVMLESTDQLITVNYTLAPVSAYNITFIEEGLESNTQWSISLANSTSNITLASSTNTIIFNVYNGSYIYYVNFIMGYSVNIQSAPIVINGGSDLIYVIFTAVPNFVTFYEVGLNNSVQWSITIDNLNGFTYYNTTYEGNGSIVIILVMGTYSFTVNNVPGYYSNIVSGSFTESATPQYIPIYFNSTNQASGQNPIVNFVQEYAFYILLAFLILMFITLAVLYYFIPILTLIMIVAVLILIFGYFINIIPSYIIVLIVIIIAGMISYDLFMRDKTGSEEE